jgi:hypothetical protein
LNSFDP